MHGTVFAVTGDALDDVQPPRLCPDCARPLSVQLVDDVSLLLALSCPVHGEVGVIDPRTELGP